MNHALSERPSDIHLAKESMRHCCQLRLLSISHQLTKIVKYFPLLVAGKEVAVPQLFRAEGKGVAVGFFDPLYKGRGRATGQGRVASGPKERTGG